MTPASSVAACRPPILPVPGSQPALPKRQAPFTSSETPDPEVLLSKRQKTAPFLSASDVIPANEEQSRQPKDIDVKRLPSQLVNGFFLGSEGIRESLPHSQGADRPTPPPLPQRPWNRNLRLHSTADGILNNPGVRKRTDVQVQKIPYKAEPSRITPIFTTGKEADFAPWKGNHAEDVLNDQTVKNGFNDKVPVSQGETGTARQSLYGVLRHKSGLQTLSALFSAAVEERQNNTRITATAPSGPPPRVTLTEARRKAFLNDLAEPAVPLRKLIRTIPQGIKGQNLLDQCFACKVPIGRAIWFAKCVGANEIRSSKRKGTNTNLAAGAELKWLKDWTSSVELFLENGFEQCGQLDWRHRMNYALNLTARLYSESLLDRDHYLDWITKATSTTNLTRLPIWLLLVRLHQQDLIGNRRRGRILVENLLELLQTVFQKGQDSLEPLIARLKPTIKWFMQTEPSCFVLPQLWKKHQECIKKCLDLRDHRDVRLLQQLCHRNEKVDPVSGTGMAKTKPARQMVIGLLDALKPPFEIAKIADQCRSTCNDFTVLVDVVLEWSSSRYRPGKFRVPLAVRLLKAWQGDHDVHHDIVRFLESQAAFTSCDSGSLGLLVSGLVRARVFSVGRFLQRTTARGGLGDCSSLKTLSLGPSAGVIDAFPANFDAIQVLAAIPLSCLSPEVRNLRNIMLSAAGFSLEEETYQIEAGKAHVASRLPGLFFASKTNKDISCASLLSFRLQGSAKDAIAEYIRRQVVLSTAPAGSKSSKEGTETKRSRLTDCDFRCLRGMCEDLDDTTLLIDIIIENLVSDDENLLASITDTVSFHLDVFAARGAVEHLHSHLFRVYMSQRARHQFPRQFLESLICLSAVFPSRLMPVSSLRQDLVRGEKALPVAACSPVSEGMAESLQQAGPTFTDEFKAVLSSGDRMEDQTMVQLFTVLADRLEKGQHHTEAENDDSLCALYARLRMFRVSQFDGLVSAWLRKMLSDVDSRVQQLVPALIRTSCTSFRAVVSVLLEILRQHKVSAEAVSPAQAHATRFLYTVDQAENQTDSTLYRLKLENARHIRECPNPAMELRARAQDSRGSNCSKTSIDALMYLALSVGNEDDFQCSDLHGVIDVEVKRLLRLPIETTDVTSSLLPELVERTTDFSMPLCRLCLQTSAVYDQSRSIVPEYDAIIQILEDLSRRREDGVWLSYLTAIGPEATRQMHAKTKESFFAMMPVLGRSSGAAKLTLGFQHQSERKLKVLSQTASSMTSVDARTSLPPLLERFAAALRVLVMQKVEGPKADPVKQDIEQPLQGDNSHLERYLESMLQMLSIQWAILMVPGGEPLFSPNPSHKQAQQEIVKTLIVLANIALSSPLYGCAELATCIFDVMAMMVDEISDEARMVCSRILNDKMRDSRVQYLFGTVKRSGTSSGPGGPDKQAGTNCTMDGLRISKDGRLGKVYQPRRWEMLEGGADASISLSLFDARKHT